MRYLAFNVHDVLAACKLSKVSITGHARNRLGQRMIVAADLIEAMAEECEVIEVYPDPPHGPAGLVLTRTRRGQWLHAVCAYDEMRILVIVTAYEPEMPYWVDERTRADD